ncbi:MAG: AsmA family protein [Acidobacteriaceae bacterium]
MVDSASPSDRTLERSRLRRIAFALGLMALLILAVAVPPFININRFRRSIVHSISEGIGRPVRADAVELALLPRPAFVLHHLTIAEDAAYGAEPVLTSDTVTASLRASTLWHRRVEIATLHFDAPSVNLTRNPAGQWNFESLLHRSPGSRASPASGTANSGRMPFPYVEATEARINFKLGAEKLPFSLEGADLAVWKESGNEWHLRVKARPVRTDLTVADAGQVRGEAVLHSGGALEDAPIRMDLEWRRVQLGEIGRLLQGEDSGWRGTVDWTARASGTLDKLLLVSDVRIEEFRRTEFVPPSTMDLGMHCQSTYGRAANALDALQCTVPLGTGQLLLRSDGPLPLTAQPPATEMGAPLPQAQVVLALQQVPAASVLDVFRHIHPGVSNEAAVAGELDGTANCSWRGPHTLHFCVGQFHTTPLAVRLPQLSTPLEVPPLLLAVSADQPATDAWLLQPVRVPLGGPGPATLTGTFTTAGPALQVTGPADGRKLLGLAQAFQLPGISGEVRSLRGAAQLTLALETAWLPQSSGPNGASTQLLPFVPSQWTGSIQLRGATLQLKALTRPVQLASAEIDLLPNSIEWNHLNGSYGRVAFDGSVIWRTPCAASSVDCSRSFLLHTTSLNAASLAAAFRSAKQSSGVLDLVNPWAAGAPKVPLLTGTLVAGVLYMGHVPVRNAALQLRIAGHTAEMLSIAGNVFGGTIAAGDLTDSARGSAHRPAKAPQRGSLVQPNSTATLTPAIGSVHWGDGAPTYKLRAVLARIQPDSVAAVWLEHWGSGVADAAFDVTTSGRSPSDLRQNARGNFSIQWADGSLLAPTSTTPAMTFDRWRAQGRIADGKLVFHSSQIAGLHLTDEQPTNTLSGRKEAAGTPVHGQSMAIQNATGQVSFARVVDVTLRPSGVLLSGRLGAIEVAPEKSATGTSRPAVTP